MKYDKTKKILLIEMTKELSSAFSIECKNSDYSFISVYSEKSAFDSLLMTSFHAALLHMQSRNDHTLSLCNTLRKNTIFRSLFYPVLMTLIPKSVLLKPVPMTI